MSSTFDRLSAVKDGIRGRAVRWLRPVVDGARRRRFAPIPADDVARAERARGRLVLPVTERPIVSVIIPVHGKFATTWMCLGSLRAARVEVGYEVIVVDDASRDETPEMLAAVVGARVVRNDENQGFVRSCNAGAAAARGELLCFLNNDTRVTDGWLDELVGTLEREPGAGLVGAKLLFPDGRLQEAGGTVFRDGSCSHYGRNRDPARPEYDYMRPVDYCSGACLLIRRALFERLGGFDPHYAPAYYEDTDLAFRVRALGLEVLYQPAAEVVHYEGVTHGRDVRRGPKRHQVINQGRFVARWREVLEAHPAPGNRTWTAGERRLRPGVLVIAERCPARGEPLRRLLERVRAGGLRTSLLVGGSADAAAARELRRAGVEVIGSGPGRVNTRFLARGWFSRVTDAVLAVADPARHVAALRARAPSLRLWGYVEDATDALGTDARATHARPALAGLEGVVVADDVAGRATGAGSASCCSADELVSRVLSASVAPRDDQEL